MELQVNHKFWLLLDFGFIPTFKLSTYEITSYRSSSVTGSLILQVDSLCITLLQQTTITYSWIQTSGIIIPTASYKSYQKNLVIPAFAIPTYGNYTFQVTASTPSQKYQQNVII